MFVCNTCESGYDIFFNLASRICIWSHRMLPLRLKGAAAAFHTWCWAYAKSASSQERSAWIKTIVYVVYFQNPCNHATCVIGQCIKIKQYILWTLCTFWVCFKKHGSHHLLNTKWQPPHTSMFFFNVIAGKCPSIDRKILALSYSYRLMQVQRPHVYVL